MQEEIEKAKMDLQSKMEAIITAGAGCFITDEYGKRVTSIFISAFEVFRAVPFFDRSSGAIIHFDFWVFFQEFYFNNGMQYSHLARMKKVEWLNDDNVIMTRDDGWVFYISQFDPPEIDPEPHRQLQNWRKYYQDNNLEEIRTAIRNEFYRMMEAQI
jgi:hypothetical protein